MPCWLEGGGRRGKYAPCSFFLQFFFVSVHFLNPALKGMEFFRAPTAVLSISHALSVCDNTFLLLFCRFYYFFPFFFNGAVPPHTSLASPCGVGGGCPGGTLQLLLGPEKGREAAESRPNLLRLTPEQLQRAMGALRRPRLHARDKAPAFPPRSVPPIRSHVARVPVLSPPPRPPPPPPRAFRPTHGHPLWSPKSLHAEGSGLQNAGHFHPTHPACTPPPKQTSAAASSC